MPAMFGNRELKIVNGGIAKSAEKLSSGYRINRAADDAAGLAISEKMRRQIRGLKQGLDNTVDGISFVQIADGAMDEAQDIVQRINELAVKAANGTNSANDRASIDEEVQALVKELDRIHTTTKFNEENVFTDKLPHLPSIHVTGSYFTHENIDIYNSGYDSRTGKATYGGLILDGKRISWDSIDSGIASFDDAGNQVFHAGSYSFNYKGEEFVINFNKDSDTPTFSHRVNTTGFPEDIYVDSRKLKLSDFKDADGNAFDWLTCRKCTYYYDDGQFQTSIDMDYFQDSADTAGSRMWGDPLEAAQSLWSDGKNITWSEQYADSVKVDAMDMWSAGSVNIDSRAEMKTFVDNFNAGPAVYRLRAGKTNSGTYLSDSATADNPNASEDYSLNGVWLERQIQVQGASGTVTKWAYVEGSLQSWNETGLKNDGSSFWKSGTDVHDAVTSGITYSFNDKSANTTINLSFNLTNDTTSLDSVIDGLDRASVYSTAPTTGYSANITTSGSSKVVVSSFSTRGAILTIKEEYDLHRNYGSKTVSDVAKGTGSVSGDTATLNIGNEYSSIKYKADISSAKYSLANDISSYANAVIERKKAMALSGQDPQSGSLGLTNNTVRQFQMNFTHQSDKSRSIITTYRYDYKDLKDSIKVQMKGYTGDADAYLSSSQRPALYEKKPDGSYSQFSYDPYEIYPAYTGTPDAAFKAALSAKLSTLYTLDVSYTDPSDPSVLLADLAELNWRYSDKAFSEMVGSSTVHFNATDYAKTTWRTGEQPNQAVHSLFESHISSNGGAGDQDFVSIQHSGEVGDFTLIPKVCMNSFVLGLSTVSCKTELSAGIAIDKASGALRTISYRRSLYGAMQNRLEHTYKNNNNIMENTQAAESRIRDTDMSKEMVYYSNANIISQAAQAMLAQSNQSRQGLLSLLSV